LHFVGLVGGDEVGVELDDVVGGGFLDDDADDEEDEKPVLMLNVGLGDEDELEDDEGGGAVADAVDGAGVPSGP
jgi:hypothetical protein